MSDGRHCGCHRHEKGKALYLTFIDEMVRWAPRESGDSRAVHDKLVAFYFILDQPPLLPLQSPIQATSDVPTLSPLFEARCNASFAFDVGEHHLQGVATGICSAD